MLRDCGAFITAWAHSGLAMPPSELLHMYSQIAGGLIAASQRSEVVLDEKTARFATGYDILLFTYVDDSIGLNGVLNSGQLSVYWDVMPAATFLAAVLGHVDAAGTLLSRGIGVGLRDSKGYTCLHKASYHNRPRMVEFLLRKKAMVNSESSLDETAWSIICGSPDHEEVSRLLIQAGADVNGSRPKVFSHLKEFAFHGNLTAVRTMLDRGCDPSPKGTDGYSPLVSYP